LRRRWQHRGPESVALRKSAVAPRVARYFCHGTACLLLGLALCLSLALSSSVWAFSSVRGDEIAECRAGEISTWNDGRDRPAIAKKMIFTYRHDAAPGWFSPKMIEAMVIRAAQSWSACGITAEVVPEATFNSSGGGSVVVQWNEKASRGNIGLANIGERTLSLSPSVFGLLRSRNPKHDAAQTLQMVISHEMGHFFGLVAHSRRCVDVLSYYHLDINGKKETCFSRDPAGMAAFAEYRHILPTACDIERCRQINATSATDPGVSTGKQ